VTAQQIGEGTLNWHFDF